MKRNYKHLLRPLTIIVCSLIFISGLSAQNDSIIKKDTTQKDLQLLMAAKNGDSTKVKELLEAGVSPNVEYNNGETA